MAEHINNIKVKAGTEKNFGLVFGIVFFILSCIPLLYQKNINTYLLFTGIIFFAIAFFKPSLLKLPNILWFKFGIMLSKIVSPIALIIVYAGSIIPMSIIVKIYGKKLLEKKFSKKSSSYWINRENQIEDFNDQF